MRRLSSLLPMSVLMIAPLVCLSTARVLSAPAPGPAINLNTPPIPGQLFSLTAQTDLSVLKTSQATVALATEGDAPALHVAFVKSDGYANVQFPCPSGGWNLSAFGGVKVDVANTGPSDINVGLRVDNPGDWHLSPWNQAGLLLPSGQTKTLSEHRRALGRL